MSEWWTYRLSDLLMFSAATYFRMFELYNTEVWPLHLVAVAISFALLAGVWRGRPNARAAACLLALCWAWVGWAYHARRYADINLAGNYFAAAFWVEAVLLGMAAWRGGLGFPAAVPGIGLRFGPVLVLAGLVGYPLLAPLSGRLWRQAEIFGMAPDPTAIVTLGVLLAGRARWWLWPAPLLWCVVSGMTLEELGQAQAWMPGLAALGTLGALAYRGNRGKPAVTDIRT